MTQEVKNPFDPKNFVAGGGLWDGKVITVISARTVIDALKYGSGAPVIGDDGNQIIKQVLEIVAVADGDERERRETYSLGSLVPTADGEGFLKVDGTPGFLHKSSEASKFFEGAVAGGFNPAILWDSTTQRQKVSALVGARFLMKAEPRKGKDGKDKTNSKGYVENKFYPVKFEGTRAVPGHTASGNGADSGALRDKAVSAVVGVLAEAGAGIKVSRTELIKRISQATAGDPDASKIIALITKESFHQGAPWVRDGTSYTLAA